MTGTVFWDIRSAGGRGFRAIFSKQFALVVVLLLLGENSRLVVWLAVSFEWIAVPDGFVGAALLDFNVVVIVRLTIRYLLLLLLLLLLLPLHTVALRD